MTSSSLRALLENFQASILSRTSTIEQAIVGADSEFKQERLAVYQDAYYLRLQEALGKSFPVVKQLAGEETFAALTHQYIERHPSQHFSLRYLGEQFSQFLAEQASDPVWVEMANFEWALEYALDAKDAPYLAFEELATLSPDSWGNLVLYPHPSLQTVACSHPTPTLWQAVTQQQSRPALAAQPQPTHWLVWRFNRQAFFRPLDPAQLWMIQAIEAGQTFGEICTGLCDWLAEDKVVLFAADTLRTWVAEGIFSGFNLKA